MISGPKRKGPEMVREIISAIPVKVNREEEKIDLLGTEEIDLNERGYFFFHRLVWGFGPYRALYYAPSKGEGGEVIYGDDQYVLARVEEESVFNSASAMVFIANAISGVLSHGHTLTTEEAARVPSIRALQLAWRAEGAKYNDSLDSLSTDQRWRRGMEGWWEEETERGFKLSHETLSGRMGVQVSEDTCTLRFWAGSPEPKEIVALDLRVRSEKELDVDIHGVPIIMKELLVGRSDRLELLWRIDRAIGGEIFASLQWLASFNSYCREEANILLASKSEADEAYRLRKEEETRKEDNILAEYDHYLGLAEDWGYEE